MNKCFCIQDTNNASLGEFTTRNTNYWSHKLAYSLNVILDNAEFTENNPKVLRYPIEYLLHKKNSAVSQVNQTAAAEIRQTALITKA